MRLHFLVIAALLSAAGCSNAVEVCAGVGQSGIILDVRDARNNASLNTAAIVTVTQRSSPFQTASGKIYTSSPLPLSLTDGRAGDYRVKVEVPGYVAWERVITVPMRGGKCPSIETQQVQVLLQPA